MEPNLKWACSKKGKKWTFFPGKLNREKFWHGSGAKIKLKFHSRLPRYGKLPNIGWVPNIGSFDSLENLQGVFSGDLKTLNYQSTFEVLFSYSSTTISIHFTHEKVQIYDFNTFFHYVTVYELKPKHFTVIFTNNSFWRTTSLALCVRKDAMMRDC